MSDQVPPETTPSLGFMLDSLALAKTDAKRVHTDTSEPLERDLARVVMHVIDRVEDIVVVLRDHLSCHDCTVAPHIHGMSRSTGDVIMPEK